MENDLTEKEKNTFSALHEVLTPVPLRNSYMVPGYTGYIPGRLSLCGKSYGEEVKSSVALCMKRRLEWMEYERTLIKSPTDIPEYFSLWYEIPRLNHHVCTKCINNGAKNVKKSYC